MALRFVLPAFARNRGPLFWIRPANWWSGRRRILRTDHSNEWRYEFLRDDLAPEPPREYPSDPEARTRPFSWLLPAERRAAAGPPPGGLSFVILGDTGEGDASQYALLPLIRALRPDFMIINGDVAYPAGNTGDFQAGFFEPYRGLGIPVWAVPGNHEYYSDGRGREFFEVFCSSIAAAAWADHGLVLKPQPGSYWELSEAGVPVAVLGVDSGQSGALDGKKGVLGLFKRKDDARQHEWLDRRLRRADELGVDVMVLFHIPKLVDAEAKSGVGLDRLHAILAAHPCVRLVVTAHIHNLQCYEPGVFERFLTDLTRRPVRPQAAYLVSGAGGAYIGSTDFSGTYPPTHRYPTPDRFAELARRGQQLVHRLGLEKMMGGDVLAAVGGLFAGRAETTDADQMRMVSLLHVEWRPGQRVRVTPHYFDDLADLYPDLPDGASVEVQTGIPPLSPGALAASAVAPAIQL